MRDRALTGFGAVTAAAVLTACASLQQQTLPDDPDVDDFARWATPLPTQRTGVVLRSAPVDGALKPPAAARAERVLHTTLDAAGELTVATGTLFVPHGPAPASGWPVIAWAHGTVGIADGCAPSLDGAYFDYQNLWLEAGYAVVASDYFGLGTAKPHAYLHGASQAHNTMDMLRAARDLVDQLSQRWVVIGHSQGGQTVFFTAALANNYAPELELLGGIALAPTAAWDVLFDRPRGRPDPAVFFLPMIMFGLEQQTAGFQSDDYLVPALDAFVDPLDESCDPGFPGQVLEMQLSWDGSFTMDPLDPRLLAELTVLEPPAAAYEQPLLSVVGSRDSLTPPRAVKTTVERLCAAGANVGYREYPELRHPSILEPSFADLELWVAERFAGVAAPNQCPDRAIVGQAPQTKATLTAARVADHAKSSAPRSGILHRRNSRRR